MKMPGGFGRSKWQRWRRNTQRDTERTATRSYAWRVIFGRVSSRLRWRRSQCTGRRRTLLDGRRDDGAPLGCLGLGLRSRLLDFAPLTVDLLPAVIPKCARRAAWTIPRKAVLGAIGTWAGEEITGMLPAMDRDARRRACDKIWQALAGEPQDALAAFYEISRARDLQDAVVSGLSEPVIAESFARAKAGDVVARFHLLPPRFRNAALPIVLAQGADPDFRTERRLSAEDADWLWDLAAAQPEKHGVQSALWEVDPGGALKRTLTVPLDEPGARYWFSAAPDEHRALLVDTIEQHAGRLPDWAVLWLRRQVEKGDAVADRAYRLLRRRRP